MTWILIILLNTQPGFSAASLAVEFNDQAACEAAAERAIKEVKEFTKESKRVIFCVPKGSPS